MPQAPPQPGLETSFGPGTQNAFGAVRDFLAGDAKFGPVAKELAEALASTLGLPPGQFPDGSIEKLTQAALDVEGLVVTGQVGAAQAYVLGSAIEALKGALQLNNTLRAMMGGGSAAAAETSTAAGTDTASRVGVFENLYGDGGFKYNATLSLYNNGALEQWDVLTRRLTHLEQNYNDALYNTEDTEQRTAVRSYLAETINIVKGWRWFGGALYEDAQGDNRYRAIDPLLTKLYAALDKLDAVA